MPSKNGQAISQARISHLATDPADPPQAYALIDDIRSLARSRGIDYLVIGFDARDPRLAALRQRSRFREYRSLLYAVYWEDGREFAGALDDRLLAPDVALL